MSLKMSNVLLVSL